MLNCLMLDAVYCNPILFQPDEVIEDYEHEGFVERNRRASGQETFIENEFTYTLYSLGGAPCILAQTECTFTLDYRTLRYGVKTVKVGLPKEPEISGSCVREGDTAVLTMRWSVFNFSLVYTKNPEGNSYYLNKAILKYNQSLDIFDDATYRGPVILETKKKSNFYFTSLGKSYQCTNAEDQGPLDLYNEDDELVGEMALYHTKIQPFVKRAKGDWGPSEHCLPKATQIMREDVVPFVASGIFVACTIVLLAGYGIYKKFVVKKTDYGFYDPNAEGGGGTKMEAHEMNAINGATVLEDETYQPAPAQPTNGYEEPEMAPPPAPEPKAVNPFAKPKGSNPFNQ